MGHAAAAGPVSIVAINGRHDAFFARSLSRMQDGFFFNWEGHEELVRINYIHIH